MHCILNMRMDDMVREMRIVFLYKQLCTFVNVSICISWNSNMYFSRCDIIFVYVFRIVMYMTGVIGISHLCKVYISLLDFVLTRLNRSSRKYVWSRLGIYPNVIKFRARVVTILYIYKHHFRLDA